MLGNIEGSNTTNGTVGVLPKLIRLTDPLWILVFCLRLERPVLGNRSVALRAACTFHTCLLVHGIDDIGF